VHLSAARDYLRRAAQALSAPELAAEDVRLAGRSLALITGAIGVEDVLDEVFASFCVGK
jgi:tRNA modification GTPase